MTDMNTYILWVRRWDTHESIDVPVRAYTMDEAEEKFNQHFRKIWQVKGIWSKEEYDRIREEDEEIAGWLKEIYT